MSYRLIATLFNVDELIVNKYVAESINNWLQNVLATKAFVSCVQNVLHTVDKGLCGQNILQSDADWYCYLFAHNQFAYVAMVMGSMFNRNAP